MNMCREGRDRGQDNSTVVLLAGLLLQYSSYGAVFLGNSLRLAFLGLGFTLVLGAALLRTPGHAWARLVPLLIISSSIALGVGLHADYQSHSTFIRSPLMQVFRLVCLALFISGVLLGRYRPTVGRDTVPFSLCLLTCFVTLPLLLFSLGQLANLEPTEIASREVGGNPIGVAYTLMNLAVILFALLLFSASKFQNILFGISFVLTGSLIVSTASRGPLIWGSMSLAYCIVLAYPHLSNRKSITRLIALSILAISVAGFLVWYAKGGKLLHARYDLLTGRMKAARQYVVGARGPDQALEGRIDEVTFLMENWEQWFMFGLPGYTHAPHNQYAEILARFGFFAGVLFLLWSANNGLRLYALPKRDGCFRFDLEFVSVATLFAYSYLQSFSSLSLEINRGLWLGFGYMMGSAARAKCRSRLVEVPISLGPFESAEAAPKQQATPRNIGELDSTARRMFSET